MTYASLLVHLQPGRSNTPLLLAAARFADRFAAHVIGIAACQPLLVVSGDGTVCGDVFTDDQRQIERDLEGSHAEFRQHLAGHGKSLEWRSRITLAPIGTCLAAESRSADLVMTGRVPADGLDLSRLADPGALTLEAGRPVFIVAPDAPPMAFDHALVGWKDTRECRRATADALPLLAQTARVTVVEIAPIDEIDAARSRVEDVVAWLIRHRVPAESRVEVAQGQDVDRLYRIVDESAVDFVVAGAYGHSRLREWVLGGVTRDLLLGGSRSVLVSH